MRKEIVELLRCPASGSSLTLKPEETHAEEIISGHLIAEAAGQRRPIVGGIPRFVQAVAYAESFGFQWRTVARTQLDSVSGQPICTQRFWTATGWRPEELRDQSVLDVGCGAGRFAEVALQAGGRIVAVNSSTAVDACYANLTARIQGAGFVSVIQADSHSLPFRRGAFPFVFCLGVLQHTPDPPESLRSARRDGRSRRKAVRGRVRAVVEDVGPPEILASTAHDTAGPRPVVWTAGEAACRVARTEGREGSDGLRTGTAILVAGLPRRDVRLPGEDCERYAFAQRSRGVVQRD